MTGFKLRTTGIGSDHYTNCATTTTIVGKSVVTLRLPMLHHLTIPAYYTFVSICRNKVLRASLMSNLPLQLTLSVFIVVTVQSKFAEIWNHVLFSLTQVFVSFASLQNLLSPLRFPETKCPDEINSSPYPISFNRKWPFNSHHFSIGNSLTIIIVVVMLRWANVQTGIFVNK